MFGMRSTMAEIVAVSSIEYRLIDLMASIALFSSAQKFGMWPPNWSSEVPYSLLPRSPETERYSASRWTLTRRKTSGGRRSLSSSRLLKTILNDGPKALRIAPISWSRLEQNSSLDRWSRVVLARNSRRLRASTQRFCPSATTSIP